MPDPKYRPDQPEYYNSSNKLDTLNNIVGGNHALQRKLRMLLPTQKIIALTQCPAFPRRHLLKK